MIFECANGARPIRLPESTRAFAYDSLHFRYGTDTKATPCVDMDDVDGFLNLPDIDKYDLVIDRIAHTAPIRICEGEKISGAATLGDAIRHCVPFRYKDELMFGSVSHLTIDFETVLKRGICGIEEDIKASLLNHTDPDKIRFLDSCQNTINAMKYWHTRYLESLANKEEYRANYENLLQVPLNPAKSFYQAVQSLWFTFTFVRLCGNWPGIGRIDILLGDYLKNDLQKGAITIDQARDILAHFFIKGCEWITGDECESGDAQHYQNILIGGKSTDKDDVVNEVSYLVLDIIEELGISDFPCSVRVNKNTHQAFLYRVAEVMRYGGGTLAIYNEDLVIDSMTKYGYPHSQALNFANDGCWETQIPGKTYFIYDCFDSLQILQKTTLDCYSNNRQYASFEELLSQYLTDLKSKVSEIVVGNHNNRLCDGYTKSSHKWRCQLPCTVVSIFEEGCIEKGFSYLEGGPIYNVVSPHIGGLADTADSLYAIKKIVFDKKLISFSDFMSILSVNWQGNEPLRQYALNKIDYYGNDNDEVDNIAFAILNSLADECDKAKESGIIMTPPGVSTFGRQIKWTSHRLASPHGHKVGEVLSGNTSPTPGSDKEGATALIKSYCKMPLDRMTTGAALDVKLLSSTTVGKNGLDALVSLIRGFINLGGYFMQIDVTDSSLLRKAQEHPEQHQTLSVRVSGWNARFVTMNREWQNMVIEQIEK